MREAAAWMWYSSRGVPSGSAEREGQGWGGRGGDGEEGGEGREREGRGGEGS